MRIRGPMHCCLSVLLLFAAFAGGIAQEGQKEKIIVPMRRGYFVAFSTTPGIDATNSSTGWSMTFAEAYFESNTIRRVFVDSGRSVYFGYALVVEPIASPGKFSVSVRALSAEDEQELRARKAFETRSMHPNYNAAGFSRSAGPQVISDGDTFALDVLVNPKTGEKVTDFVTVSTDESQLRDTSTHDVAPRDFTLEDVEMKMINYQLLLNGELVAGGKRSGAATGPVIWFHLTERGRFIFSLRPHNGYDFNKIGTIERNRMKFTFNGDRYEWISDVPVVSGRGPWNLYVLYDPNYVPDSFFLGVNAAPKAETSEPSTFDKLITTRRRSKAAAFGRPPDTTKQGEVPDKTPTARLIIGAAGRVENLLPLNSNSLAQPGLKDNYSKWLHADVAYIITAEEAWAFKQLQTDEQREAFVDSFWRARDPDPLTKENEYRREHYQRIAHANENFSFGDVPGWISDRGRTYIIYGKPDEVEKKPYGEKWIYKQIPTLGSNVPFEFADLDGKAEFRLQPRSP